MLHPDFERIPEELKVRPQWVCWSLEEREGKPTKVPKNPKTGGNAKADAPATWGEFDLAVRHWEAHKNNGIAGIGYEFSTNDPFTGIDLDKCLNPESGEIEPWARAIIDRLQSYTEISPSGCGVHIIVKGVLPAGGNRKGNLELYSYGRYFTVTGQHLEGTPTTIEDRQAEIKALHAETFGQPKTAPKDAGPGPAVELSDFAVIDKAHEASNGHKFAPLWQGDTKGYPSPSEADLALCCSLAFWTGPDPARIDRLFRQSGLMRPKWDRSTAGSTYGAITIEKAISQTTEIYTQGGGTGHQRGNGTGQTGSIGQREAQTTKQKRSQGPQGEPVLSIKTVTARELGNKDFPPRCWAVPDLITDGITILAGKPKAGKSWLALDIGVAVATAGMALGKIQVEQGEVLYLALEDSERRLKERLEKIVGSGEPFPEGLHIVTATGFPPLYSGGLPALDAWLKDHPRVKLVIIDTLGRVKPARGHNQDSYAHDTIVISALQKIANDHQLALILVHHTKKAGATDFVDEVSGTFGLTGAADCVAVLARQGRGEMDGILKLTGRDIEEKELALKFDPNCGRWELLGEASAFSKSPERQNILLLLKETGPRTPTQLAKLLNKEPASIRKLLWNMKKAGEVKPISGTKYIVC
jgi:hypothetical protein